MKQDALTDLAKTAKRFLSQTRAQLTDTKDLEDVVLVAEELLRVIAVRENERLHSERKKVALQVSAVFRNAPQLPKSPQMSASSRQLVPFGTYGKWDYPNTQYSVPPTEADIAELCRQKLLRDPSSKLFGDYTATRNWFITKGWIPTRTEKTENSV